MLALCTALLTMDDHDLHVCMYVCILHEPTRLRALCVISYHPSAKRMWTTTVPMKIYVIIITIEPKPSNLVNSRQHRRQHESTRAPATVTSPTACAHIAMPVMDECVDIASSSLTRSASLSLVVVAGA